MKFDIDYLARLARIELSPTEKEKFDAELQKILDFVAQLNEVDTEEVEPLAHVVNITNIKRADVAQETPDESRENLIQAAPQQESGFIKIKSVFEK